MGSFDNNLSMFWDNMDSKIVKLAAEGDMNIKCRMADGKTQSRKFNSQDLVSELYLWVHN